MTVARPAASIDGLCEAAVRVLLAAAPEEKVHQTVAVAERWRARGFVGVGLAAPPDRPARPAFPELLPPKRMRRRRAGGIESKIALVHALAHIELNAIDLAWDIVVRFADQDLPIAFFDDWVGVAREEAEHFSGLASLLGDMGSHYGALPAHDGLWEAAQKTTDDLLYRLAVVPMVLEARALDTAPTTLARLEEVGDHAFAAVLRQVLDDEVAHVAVGVRWFDFLCHRRRLDPAATFQSIVRRHFTKGLKAPFNHDARQRAGLPREYYEPLAAPPSSGAS